jgi:CRISPR-associated protein Csb3
MSNPNPSFSVNVDPSNPGQFFACCGLLELADRLWPGAEGWFESGKFCVAFTGETSGTLGEVLGKLAGCKLVNAMTEAQHSRFAELTRLGSAGRKPLPGAEDELKGLDALRREAAIVLGVPFNLTIDWFHDDLSGGSRFKTWAGRQSVLDIATAMKTALNELEWRNESCMSYRAHEIGLPFNFDSDLGGQGGAIDIGFSFDPLAGSALTRIESTARPALELLSFIGLQRFRPTEVKGENRFHYTLWSQSLPIAAAMPTATCAVRLKDSTQYEFRLLYRTKYLKSFLPAIPIPGGSDE